MASKMMLTEDKPHNYKAVQYYAMCAVIIALGVYGQFMSNWHSSPYAPGSS
jgi:hypothetical protein